MVVRRNRQTSCRCCGRRAINCWWARSFWLALRGDPSMWASRVRRVCPKISGFGFESLAAHNPGVRDRLEIRAPTTPIFECERLHRLGDGRHESRVRCVSSNIAAGHGAVSRGGQRNWISSRPRSTTGCRVDRLQVDALVVQLRVAAQEPASDPVVETRWPSRRR